MRASTGAMVVTVAVTAIVGGDASTAAAASSVAMVSASDNSGRIAAGNDADDSNGRRSPLQSNMPQEAPLSPAPVVVLSRRNESFRRGGIQSDRVLEEYTILLNRHHYDNDNDIRNLDQQEEDQHQHQHRARLHGTSRQSESSSAPCMDAIMFESSCIDFLLMDSIRRNGGGGGSDGSGGIVTQNDYVAFIESLDPFPSSPSRQFDDPNLQQSFHNLPLRLQLRYVDNVCRHVDDGDDDYDDCFDSMFDVGMNREEFGFLVTDGGGNSGSGGSDSPGRAATLTAEDDIQSLCRESYVDFVDTGYVKDCVHNPRPPDPDHGSGVPRPTMHSSRPDDKSRPPISEEVVTVGNDFSVTTLPPPNEEEVEDGDDQTRGTTGGGDFGAGGGGGGDAADALTMEDTSTTTSPLNIGMIIGIVLGGIGLLCGCIAFMVVGKNRNEYGEGTSGTGTGGSAATGMMNQQNDNYYSGRSFGTTEYATRGVEEEDLSRQDNGWYDEEDGTSRRRVDEEEEEEQDQDYQGEEEEEGEYDDEEYYDRAHGRGGGGGRETTTDHTELMGLVMGNNGGGGGGDGFHDDDYDDDDDDGPFSRGQGQHQQQGRGGGGGGDGVHGGLW